MKCSRTFPCDRCFKRAEPCQPPPEILTREAPPLLLDLVMARADPSKHASLVLELFRGMLEAGKIDRDLAKETM